ncbi:MAG TPA: AI-2E family transporter, partial [Kineosporiaceae bacterium]|nr:AI-2E family transporter [Kineosporiaceae bacterium]
ARPAAPPPPAPPVPTPVVAPRERVPVRTILATIGLVLATVAALWVLVEVRQIVTWIVIAAFFAVALAPLVGLVERRVTRGRRALATLLVFVLVLVVLGGLVAAFAVPLAKEGTSLAGQLPQIVQDARAGRGPIGGFLDRTNALDYVQQNQDKIRAFASGLTTPAAGVLKGVATGVAGSLTIFVLAYLMVLEGPKLVGSSLGLLPVDRRDRVQRVAHDCGRSVTGYITGNLLISVICGVLTYAVLKVAGVPFAALLSLFVAIADLIPLVGATLGAVIASLAAFVHSVPAGIAVVVFFVLYQQLENHLLQPLILSRTVDLNPLTVLVSILVAVELAGILGALLAIPIAGMVQVVLRDLWDNRRGRPKAEATVGEDEQPATA